MKKGWQMCAVTLIFFSVMMILMMIMPAFGAITWSEYWSFVILGVFPMFGIFCVVILVLSAVMLRLKPVLQRNKPAIVGWCDARRPKVKRILRPFGWWSNFLNDSIYPHLDFFGWSKPLFELMPMALAAVAIGYIQGPLVAGVTVAVVFVIYFCRCWEDLSSIMHYALLAWLLAAVAIAGIEQPEITSRILSDPRLPAVLGALMAGLVGIYAMRVLYAGLYFDVNQVRREKLRQRLASETGYPLADVDRFLLALDDAHEDKDNWDQLSTGDVAKDDWDRQRANVRARREQRRAERAARKAAK